MDTNKDERIISQISNTLSIEFIEYEHITSLYNPSIDYR